MTVKTRITFFIVGAGFIASLLFSIIVFVELVEQPFHLLDSVLKEEAYNAVRMFVNRSEIKTSKPFESLSADLDHYWAEIYDQATKKILFQTELAKTVKFSRIKTGTAIVARPEALDDKMHTRKGISLDTPFRVRSYSFRMNDRKFIVQIARPIVKLNEEIWELVFGILAGLVFSTLALTAISRFVAGKILKPVGQIKDLAKSISEKNLKQRIPAGEGKDEFNELARTINRMLDRLQYSFLQQKAFLFDTSHELKTPLTTIRLAIDAIRATDKEELPSFVKENLFRLNDQVLRMERLVKDLLNLSALETGPGIDWKPVELTALLSSLVDDYRFLAEAEDITLNVHLSKPLFIQGDAEKLHRAFSNILDNAVKYNFKKGRIDLSADKSGTALIVTVENTGPGVAETEISKVFDQFYRIEKSRSMEHGGSGLGLAIVKKIIDLHGGTVDFQSQQGGSTRVIVRFP